ncbi:MAG: hypothetical protein C4532_16380 [Candidatus Abyssobacteria bacterium SURF_17]|uniref:Uncharacterized protein n=1 Tax=Candidatus Abyssobacteria bacterium SURF_17 TaxID=2093361 RepID=A0A419ERU7_9BACT|nr:MAG: hypothetical protein C4532_16380 [Candidatus Abyssubacteria bacterium SURF_17]
MQEEFCFPTNHPDGRCGRTFMRALSLALFLMLIPAMAVFAEDVAEGLTQEAVGEASDEETNRQFGLWPFLSVVETPTSHEFSLRPFYTSREWANGSEKKVQALWPIYLYKRSEEDVTIRILPLYTFSRDVYRYEDSYEYESEYMLFPLLFGGDSSDEGGYFAFFPFGGTLKNFLGRDEVNFFLFPLYLDYSKDELYQRNYLWPVLSFSSGGDYNGFRLWPLFGHFEKRGEYRREFVLWPFYHRQRFDLNNDTPGERMLVLPFYAREDSQRRSYRAFLWPFFTYENNYAKNFEQRETPWPFVVRTRGEHIHRNQFWPLYGHTQTDDTQKDFVLWPFWHQRVFELEGDAKRHERFLMPFVSSTAEVSESQGVLKSKFKLWPLFRSRKHDDGTTDFRMFSLLWFEDEQGFEFQYSPLWTIYERESRPDGTGHTYALWRLFRHERSPEGAETLVPLLFSHTENTASDSEETAVLGGLFGTSRAGEERTTRLLYFIDIHH